MKIGSVIFDDSFEFSDGQTGEKLLVLLNDGDCGSYHVVKTTSKGGLYKNTYGCNLDHRYSSFFLPLNSSILEKNTWIQLDEVFEFNARQFRENISSLKLKQIGTLEVSITQDLLSCISRSDDIEENILDQILNDTKSLAYT